MNLVKKLQRRHIIEIYKQELIGKLCKSAYAKGEMSTCSLKDVIETIKNFKYACSDIIT
jgi:hypothetical protein